MKLLILSIFLMLVFISCDKDCNPIQSNPPSELLFVEKLVFTKGELIHGDSTKIKILHVEPGMFYNFDPQKRLLEYTSGESSRVPINDDLLVLFASTHIWFPPDQAGSSVWMIPVYYRGAYYIEPDLSFFGLQNDGAIELLINNEYPTTVLPIDSQITTTSFRFKTHVQIDGDTALIKLTDVVTVRNHGFLLTNQIKWTNLTGEKP